MLQKGMWSHFEGVCVHTCTCECVLCMHAYMKLSLTMYVCMYAILTLRHSNNDGRDMYVCMYVCIYACMYALRTSNSHAPLLYKYSTTGLCMHVCVYVCMCVCMYACTILTPRQSNNDAFLLCKYSTTGLWPFSLARSKLVAPSCGIVCMHACMHVCMFVCMDGWMCVFMYVYRSVAVLTR